MLLRIIKLIHLALRLAPCVSWCAQGFCSGNTWWSLVPHRMWTLVSRVKVLCVTDSPLLALFHFSPPINLSETDADIAGTLQPLCVFPWLQRIPSASGCDTKRRDQTLISAKLAMRAGWEDRLSISPKWATHTKTISINSTAGKRRGALRVSRNVNLCFYFEAGYLDFRSCCVQLKLHACVNGRRIHAAADPADEHWSWISSRDCHLSSLSNSQSSKRSKYMNVRNCQYSAGWLLGETPSNISHEEATICRFYSWVLYQNHSTGKPTRNVQESVVTFEENYHLVRSYDVNRYLPDI